VPGSRGDTWLGWVGEAPEPSSAMLPDLAGWQELGDLPALVVTWAARLVGAQDALLWLVEGEDQRLVVRCGTGRFSASVGRSLRKGEELAGEVWRTGTPLAVGDRTSAGPGQPREDRGPDGMPAVVCVPLVRGGDVVGVLGVASDKPGRAFGQAEIERLRGFAELARAMLDDAEGHAAARRELAERIRTEEWLRRSEARYREVFEQLPALVYIEMDGGGWVYESPRVEEIFGYTPEEAGQPGFWKTLIHPDDRERVLAEDERVERTGDPWRMEYRKLARDGRVVWVRDHAVLVRGEPGEPSYWHGLIIDITEQKLAEQATREALARERRALARERQATRQLRALDEMKNVFLNAVSHDLRTPLAAVVGIALTLRRAGSRLTEQDAADLVDRLVVNAGKLDRLLSDLLDLDRLSQGIVTPQLRRTDLAALVGRIAKEWQETGRPLELAVEPVVAQVDPAMVERIVENLLANAERHTTPGTPVWVRLARRDQGVLITVEDAGAGVPPGLRAALFEPFRQGPQVPAHAPGVGIGLTLVARFAELHGGRAWVEERPGGGASFQVLLCDPPTPPAAAAPPTRQDGRGHAEPRREHLKAQEPPSGAGSA
jgi:PAS domain S-box-containing protein